MTLRLYYITILIISYIVCMKFCAFKSLVEHFMALTQSSGSKQPTDISRMWCGSVGNLLARDFATA